VASAEKEKPAGATGTVIGDATTVAAADQRRCWQTQEPLAGIPADIRDGF